jgi:thiamine pyrophosphate-dependent acetolactate synthase large subunit-like protein
MSARLKRRIALLLLAMLGFTQLNVALASCAMDGSAMAAMAGTGDDPCKGCDTPLANSHDQISSVCATHCATADQPAGVSAVLTVPAIQRAALVLPHLVFASRSTGLDGPPAGAPPRRILLHSFLI